MQGRVHGGLVCHPRNDNALVVYNAVMGVSQTTHIILKFLFGLFNFGTLGHCRASLWGPL